jgi:riboflavin synthase
MFTGIVKSLGIINKIEKFDSQLKLVISVSTDIFNTTNIGDSVLVNGVCLTAVNKQKNKVNWDILFFDVVDETLQKTNFKLLKYLEKVNLETPLKMSDGLDGHIVQGHIDSTGLIINNELVNNNWLLEIKIDKKWIKYCITKGSIAIDGISLTVAKINDNYDDKHGSVSMSIIPHTLENTNLQFKKKDDTVNVETDFFAKYIEKLLPKKEENEQSN